MATTAKVFASGRSQAIRLPKEFRVSTPEVHLKHVPGGILVTESDPWDIFDDGCDELDESFFEAMESRDRGAGQTRDFSGGLE